MKVGGRAICSVVAGPTGTRGLSLPNVFFLRQTGHPGISPLSSVAENAIAQMQGAAL